MSFKNLNYCVCTYFSGKSTYEWVTFSYLGLHIKLG